MCLDISQGKRNGFSLWYNNNHDSRPDERIYSETYSLPQIIGACAVKPGDVIEVQFDCKGGDSSRIEVYAAILDETAFREAYDILNQSTLQLTSFSNTAIDGTINCTKDGLMYTSVPQNGENWKVFVDGQQVEPILICGVMLGVPLTQGQHAISFRYENTAFTAGLIISICSFAAFIALCMVYYKPWRKFNFSRLRHFFIKKGKYDK